MPRSQDLSGGSDSTNLQAGRDIVYNGVTAAEVREIALDVYEANILRLTGIAEDVARGRAERITLDYLEKLKSGNPAALNSIQDPDMLNTIFTAQKAYAYSGEEDLEKVLVDLLVDRSGQQDRELKTLVLNEAIAALPKLSIRQRKSIAFWFFIRYTRYIGPLNLDMYYANLARGVGHFSACSRIGGQTTSTSRPRVQGRSPHSHGWPVRHSLGLHPASSLRALQRIR